MEDSSKVFAIGNIEQVAVADGTVDDSLTAEPDIRGVPSLSGPNVTA